VRPGREHDTACLRHHAILPVIALAAPDLPTLADLATKAKPAPSTSPSGNAPTGSCPTTTNLIHAHLRSQAERANSLLKTCTVVAVGTALADGPRTDPSVRDYRTGLLPQVLAAKRASGRDASRGGCYIKRPSRSLAVELLVRSNSVAQLEPMRSRQKRP
jgi:hypothetical protein